MAHLDVAEDDFTSAQNVCNRVSMAHFGEPFEGLDIERIDKWPEKRLCEIEKEQEETLDNTEDIRILELRFPYVHPLLAGPPPTFCRQEFIEFNNASTKKLVEVELNIRSLMQTSKSDLPEMYQGSNNIVEKSTSLHLHYYLLNEDFEVVLLTNQLLDRCKRKTDDRRDHSTFHSL